MTERDLTYWEREIAAPWSDIDDLREAGQALLSEVRTLRHRLQQVESVQNRTVASLPKKQGLF